ncbi:virA/G regulated protein [Agrobacterium larrymoorei]|uniref:VirA/G regulated protein n=1 Tax=Agrobacterium larrymoorei TaxID=160699 RepID=A0A4D7E132_9HYPH|nr:virA/G regulated protein [Agrobacterium larrymoorei]QCJ00990.1 virA/G regulated protein [Agrobacterium larrymoorei]QYA10328.1 virA/G regulated protein [Agrobacterium larrymoorei]
MKPLENSKADIIGSTASLLEVPAGAAPVFSPTEPKCARSEDQTERSAHSSTSFEYDNVRLGTAEREAYESWDGRAPPTWKDLVLKARLDATDDSTWLVDLGRVCPSIFEYDGMPLGEAERQAYKEWQENAQPTWEDLVVNARMAELGHPGRFADVYDCLGEGENVCSDSLKRKRSESIKGNMSDFASFNYDEMKLGQAERAAYDDWSELEPPTWKDLVLKARRDAIDEAAWTLGSGEASSSIFEYEGIPLGEVEKRAYEQWEGEAQPTWEDLVVNARMAELGHLSSFADANDALEEALKSRSDAPKHNHECTIDQKGVSLASFAYDDMKLGAPERAAHERWIRLERPNWEDLIVDARQAAEDGASVSTMPIVNSPSSVFSYEGKSLGDGERLAYRRWGQLAQPRWQDLDVNSRRAELDSSAWTPDERDPFDESEALCHASQTGSTNSSGPALGDLSELGQREFTCEAAQETTHMLSSARSQLETRRALYFGPSGPNAIQTESIAASDSWGGACEVKRLGTKSRRAATATTNDFNYNVRRLLSDKGGSATRLPSPEKAVRSRGDNIGTYGSRKNERERLATETGKFESEHIFGFKVVHDILRATKEGRRLERPMPAYLECKELHRQHVGTGRGRTGLIGRGWPDDASYRSDQKATLTDPVASAEGAIASNGYQLNQLGYAHQLANDGLQSVSPEGVSLPIQVATTSYNYTVSRDPILSPPGKQQEPQLLHLGPRGQTEAVLARETALTGKWPTIERERQVYREFLTLYDAKRDLEVKSLPPRQKKKALLSALNRTADLIGASPAKAKSSNAEDNATAHDERRAYESRERSRAEYSER